MMKGLKQFNIQFVGLKEGKHSFEYQIDKKFFDAFQFEDFIDTNVQVDINFVKKSTFLELTFIANGTVTVPCDISNEVFDQEIKSILPLVVNFGEEFNDENEELLILPHGAYEFNVAQYVYEMIVLAVPSKRIHPNVLDGTMQSEALKKLQTLEIREEKIIEEIDPRWDKLKNLLTEKNT